MDGRLKAESLFYRPDCQNLISNLNVVIAWICINIQRYNVFTLWLTLFLRKRNNQRISLSVNGIVLFIEIIRQTLVEMVSVAHDIGLHLHLWADLTTFTDFPEFNFVVDVGIVASGQ